MQTRLAQGGPPRQETIWYVAIAGYTRRLAIATYSAGWPLDAVARQVEIALSAAREYVQSVRDEPFDLRSRDSYMSAIWLLSLGYSLDVSHALLTGFVDAVEQHGNRGKDELYERLLELYSLRESAAATKVLHPRPYRLLLDALEAEAADRPRLISDYLKHYYAQSRGTCWWGSHLREDSHSDYTGYWCFEAVATVRALDIPDSAYADNPFYPRDLAISRSPARKPTPHSTRKANHRSPADLELRARSTRSPAPDTGVASSVQVIGPVDALSEEDALKLLAHLLLPDDPSLVTEIELALGDPQTFRERFADRLENRGIEPHDPVDAWALGLCDGLAERGRVGIVDWRADIEDIINGVDVEASPLNEDPDRWAWIEEFQAMEIDTQGWLQLVADRLSQEGWTLANLEPVMNFSRRGQSQQPWTRAGNLAAIGRPRPVFEMHEMREVHHSL